MLHAFLSGFHCKRKAASQIDSTATEANVPSDAISIARPALFGPRSGLVSEPSSGLETTIFRHFRDVEDIGAGDGISTLDPAFAQARD